MLKNATSWWKEQMRGLVPASLRLYGQPWRPMVVAAITNPGQPTVRLFLRGRHINTPLGEFNLNETAFPAALARLPKAQRQSPVLQLPPDLLLDRTIILPLAAEQDLQRVVTWEMDRLTPFRADEVLWSCVAGKRDTVRNQLHVRLTIVPSVRLRPILTALHDAGLFPVRIEAAGSTEPSRAIPLGNDRRYRVWHGPRFAACALAGCGILAAVAVALPFGVQSIALTSMGARIDALRPLAMEARALRLKIETGTTTADAIATARSQVGTPLQSLALLTDVLPDDTFLTSLSLRQRKVTISGRSAAAARLIGAMATTPFIHGPAFTAPVIHDETDGRESFSISAELGA
jgi:general secretion pathway protein L